jgi:hypothetical protein
MSYLRMTTPRFLLGRELVALLLLALVSVPVFQAAHMLTHVETVGAAPDAALVAQAGDMTSSEEGASADPGVDKICLDCLALAAFSIVLSTLPVHFFSPVRRLLTLHLNSTRRFLDFSSLYLSRAPPQA